MHAQNRFSNFDPNLKRALSVAEFTHRFGIGKTSAYAMIANGTLKSVRVGGRRLIPMEAAEELLRSGAK
ncbi:MAG: helix-turn-helix domain-containing protein [Roseiarcus sp.]|jgi:excisionase family DNA binding protein